MSADLLKDYPNRRPDQAGDSGLWLADSIFGATAAGIGACWTTWSEPQASEYPHRKQTCSFFNTHTPSLVGKQFGFLISVPLSQNANLREILKAWVELQQSHLEGIVTDEYGDSAESDGLVQDLAEGLVQFAQSGYIRPSTFLGVGRMKVFWDDIWGRLHPVFEADHRAFRQMGIYDLP